MRSPPDRLATRRVAAALALAFGAAAQSAGAADAPALPASSTHAAATPDPAPLTPEQVRSVVDGLRADPSFAPTETKRSLRWKAAADAPSAPQSVPAWVFAMVRWLADAGRGLVWLLAALAVALVAVTAWRWASVRSDAARARSGLLPSHVNDLDIRPENLPADIAAAARTLWQHGDARAALSMLYRGALSRLVHGHGAAIGAASTEGECVSIAARLIDPLASAFFAQLVRAWQTVVYAGRTPEAADIDALCDGFDRHFAPVRGTAPRAGSMEGAA